MSLDPQSEVPSKASEGTTSLSLAETVRERGAGLIDGLEQALPGSTERAEAVSSFAVVAGVGLGFGTADAQLCREVARLHDVGLIYVPVHIATREPAELTPSEAELYAGHYQAGANLAAGVGVPEVICGWLAANAERFDGTGPAGLARGNIPVVSRVARAARACERVLNHHMASAPDAGAGPAIDELRSLAGTELDPVIVEALASSLIRTA